MLKPMPSLAFQTFQGKVHAPDRFEGSQEPWAWPVSAPEGRGGHGRGSPAPQGIPPPGGQVPRGAAWKLAGWQPPA